MTDRPAPRRRAQRPLSSDRARWTLLTVGRLLPAQVCPLCAAVVAADGADAHTRWHTAASAR